MLLRQVDNPPNPFLSQHAEWLEPAPTAKFEVFEETARSILSKNDSPDIPFTWSVNPYRGCQHACAYCYARPYHEYLGYGAGTDFDTKIVVKVNAAELLEAETSRNSWKQEVINFSGITDCYQPLEASYELTRGCLEVCLRRSNPVAVITKSFLIVRDAELLAELHRRAGAHAFISIPFADAERCKLIEPQAPAPARRFEAIRRLHQAGVPVGVIAAPIIPGLNDTEIPAILQQAAEAGACWAGYTALRLPGSVESVFVSRLREALPLRADRIINRLREMRGGKMNNAASGERMRGEGAYWESIRSLFALHRDRLGLRSMGPTPAMNIPETVPAPAEFVQLSLDF